MRRHQFDCPICGSAAVVQAMPGAEIDRRRLATAVGAAMAGEELGEGQIAIAGREKPHRIDHNPIAAAHFEGNYPVDVADR